MLVDDVGTSGHADVIEMFQILFFADVVFTAFHNRAIKTGGGGEYQNYSEQPCSQCVSFHN